MEISLVSPYKDIIIYVYIKPRNPEQQPFTSKEIADEETEPSGPLTPEQKDQSAHWLEVIAKEQEIEQQRKALETIAIEKMRSELNTVFDVWLTPEKLDSLHAIKTMAEAIASPLRTEAKLALAEILKCTKAMKDLIQDDEHDALMKKYRVLSQAVGMINSGEVDHTR